MAEISFVLSIRLLGESHGITYMGCIILSVSIAFASGKGLFLAYPRVGFIHLRQAAALQTWVTYWKKGPKGNPQNPQTR